MFMIRLDKTVLPDANLGEIVESRVGKRLEQGMIKANVLQHGVIIDLGLTDLNRLQIHEASDCVRRAI